LVRDVWLTLEHTNNPATIGALVHLALFSPLRWRDGAPSGLGGAVARSSRPHRACCGIDVGGQVRVNTEAVGEREEEFVFLLCVRFNGNTRRRVDLDGLRRGRHGIG
jgi:hypothetical protein